MDLYIARHGESLGNTGEKICDDPELSMLGHEQAERLALRMKNIHLDAIISSPHIRAVETAAETAKLKGMEIELFPLLFEVGTCPGYEGKGLDELRKVYPYITMYSDGKTYPLSVTEENTEITYNRAKEAIDRIRVRFGDDASVMLFAHGSFNNYLTNAAIGFPVRSDFNFCQENTGLTCIRFVKDNGRDKTKIEFANDYCHLFHKS
ncbi:MAG: histidine phosphatase family protein [Clostridia bacterium]|nr:histidine phosphatase family protein [Clostridia bacterium]